MSTENFDIFASPFSWRYGTPEMRHIWSETHKRVIWRRLWVSLARAQVQAGLVTPEQVNELEINVRNVDIARAHAIESEIHHDLMAEVRTFAEQCPGAGGIIHLGATSMDIEDNADVLRLRESLDLVLSRLANLLRDLVTRIECYADLACMAYTHMQPAEITTVGFRLAQYGQDLLSDLTDLYRLRHSIRGKGFRGAVGTSASYMELLEGTGLSVEAMEAQILQEFDLTAFTVTTQTYPRKQDLLILNALASLAGSIYKFSLDLRVLQSPPFGEWSEPFGKKQVGSSAMPFKRNPINAEKLSSLGRYVATLPRVAWDNAAHSMLERTLDDSANRRSVLPEAFLAVDEMLRVGQRLIVDLRIDTHAIKRNMQTYGTFSAVERLLMALSRAGASRQEMHEVLREHSLVAWKVVNEGHPNPLVEQLQQDERILAFLSAERIADLMNADTYTGDVSQRLEVLVRQIQSVTNNI